MSLVKFLVKVLAIGAVLWAFVHFSAPDSIVVQTWNFIWFGIILPIFRGIISLGNLPPLAKIVVSCVGITVLMFGLMKK